MRKSPLFLLVGAIFAAPAFAGGHGGGGGFGGGHGLGSSMSMSRGNALGSMHSSSSMGHINNPDTHGALVSQTAHEAQDSGNKVGPQVREVARSNKSDKAEGASDTDTDGRKTKTAKAQHTHPVNHGQVVSQTAHKAHTSGMKVGPQVRTVARSKSQGPSHANAHAIAAVNGAHGNAASNSVLGSSAAGTSIKHGKGGHR